VPGQEFYGPVGQYTHIDEYHGDLHIDVAKAVLVLPDDPTVVMPCPQCTKPTWRYTRLCRNCELDLHWWGSRYLRWHWWLLRWIQK
jgi:hypothetical protein